MKIITSQGQTMIRVWFRSYSWGTVIEKYGPIYLYMASIWGIKRTRLWDRESFMRSALMRTVGGQAWERRWGRAHNSHS